MGKDDSAVATNRQREFVEDKARLADEQMTPEQKARVHKTRYIAVETVREGDSSGAKSVMIYDTEKLQRQPLPTLQSAPRQTRGGSSDAKTWENHVRSRRFALLRSPSLHNL